MQVRKRVERPSSPRRVSHERLTLPLKGPGGEPIDLRRTLCSHGFIQLAPSAPDDDYRGMTTTLALRDGARTIRFFEESPGRLAIDVTGPHPGARTRAEIVRSVHVMLALDDDLSPFYALLAGDPILEWATKGAGRLYRSPTAFEDVIKTILTTNCAWSATVRMNNALVQHLGAVAPGEHTRSRRRKPWPMRRFLFTVTSCALDTAGPICARWQLRSQAPSSISKRCARRIVGCSTTKRSRSSYAHCRASVRTRPHTL